MKKLKTLLTVCFAAVVGVCAMLTGCSTTENELSCYRGEKVNPDGSMLYNTELFYSNSVQQGFPDPQVLDDTARSGYYYLFGTASGFFTMRSKNLTEWENVGPTFDHSYDKEVEDCTNVNTWAPEVIYDDGTYYLFFSSTPKPDSKVDATDPSVALVGLYNMYVATSDKPEGPYKLVDFTSEDLPAATRHTYNTVTGKRLTADEALSGDYAYMKTDDGLYYEAAFPHYFAKYCLFSPDELSKVVQKRGVTAGSDVKPNAMYWGNIDPHPYIDPRNGDKYLYFKMEEYGAGWNIILTVQMQDWLTPIWSTAEYLLANGYYTMEDWKNGQNEGVSYEQTPCNEGPFMLYHKDKDGNELFYLTYSVNAYTSSSYQVGMAVAESPTGPFRKLTEAEGGRFLSSQTTESQSVSGAGHHSFMTIGDQLYIIYHRHDDYTVGGAERYAAVDEVKWVKIKDKFGADMEIPYVNGPTDSMQPQPAAVSGYKNVASEATVTTSGGNVTALGAVTDGLLTVHKTANPTFMDYIPETKIDATTTFTFDFPSARNARAVMIYNSVIEDEIFYTVSRIEFTLADGSVRVVRDVKFDTEQYCETGGQDGDRVIYVKSGAAAFIEFYDVDVKTIKITVDVPEGQEQVGLSEIRILGKAA